MCHDVEHVTNKCLRLLADQEDLIEHWWLNKRKDEDLFSWLCIRKLKLCCMPGRFGANCERKCPGYPDNICGGSEKGECEGAGSRKGSGLCVCNKGYDGELCDQCSRNYLMIDGKCQECDRVSIFQSRRGLVQFFNAHFSIYRHAAMVASSWAKRAATRAVRTAIERTRTKCVGM